MATDITSRVVVPLSYIQGSIQVSSLSGSIVIIPQISAVLHSSALSGSVVISLDNTREADWPDTGQTSAWVLHSEQFVYAPGLNVTIPAFSFQAEGRDDLRGSLSIILPMLAFDWRGSSDPRGSLDISIPAIRFGAEGGTNERGTLSISIPALTFSAIVRDDAFGALAVTIPPLRVSLSGADGVEGALNIVIPLLEVLFQSSPVDYQNMVLNLRNSALTEYSNYDFNSMCNLGGVNLGATATAIFNLNLGGKDDSAEIDWNFRTPYLDLDARSLGKIREVWFSYKSDGDVMVTAVLPDGAQYEYPLAGIEITEDGIRVKFGRGLRSQYLAIDVSNVNGSDIVLDSMKLLIEKARGQR